MGLTRRQFLQQSGGTLAALAASELGLWSACDRYQQGLAAPTSRKLALLIGINQYPFSLGLEGSITDVELQRELLIHRFGFRAADILVLTDWQATREAVTTAFMEHLGQQAQAGDTVVVHFSGLGTLLNDPGTGGRPALVMADATPTGDIPTVNDLLLETLGLLVRSLKTDRVTTILDTSYVYPGQPLQGNLRIRSYASPSTAQPSEAELALQEALLTQLRLTRDRRPPADLAQLPGVVIAAADPQQVATEGRWNRLSAGLLTSALTQAIWQATPATAIAVSVQQATRQIELLANQQQPQLTGQRGTTPPGKAPDSKLTPYFLPVGSPLSDGAIVGLEDSGNTAQIWLGGLPPSLLEQYGVNSLFSVLPVNSSDRTPPILLQLISRDGLTAKAKRYAPPEAIATEALASLQVGQSVQEAVRILSHNIGLTVALDHSLERIERVDAISAFTAVPRVSSAIAGEQPADFLFSKVQVQPTQLAALPTATFVGLDNSAAPISYGLFTPGRDIILSSTGESGEAVKVAVRRLVPKLQTLLATKLLHLTVNQATSQLGVNAQLEQLTASSSQVLIQQATSRGPKATAPTVSQASGNVQIPIGSRIRYRIDNLGIQPIYSLVIALDSASNLMWLHTPLPDPDPASPPQPDEMALAILPNSTVLLPSAIAGSEWQLQGTPGFAETFVILSRTPFQQTLATLVAQQRSGNSAIAGTAIHNPLDVVQAILQDLSQPTPRTTPLTVPDAYTLDVQAWATLRFTYQMV